MDKQIAQEPSSLPTNSCEIFYNDDQEKKIVLKAARETIIMTMMVHIVSVNFKSIRAIITMNCE